VGSPWARLEVPGSYYASAMAVSPEHRGKGLGTRMLEMAKEQARRSGREQVSLLIFERNEGTGRAVELRTSQVGCPGSYFPRGGD